MEWFPTVAFSLNFVVLGMGMLLANNLHYDKHGHVLRHQVALRSGEQGEGEGEARGATRGRQGGRSLRAIALGSRARHLRPYEDTRFGLDARFGLLIGKPLGSTLMGFIAVALGICKLPLDLSWRHIFGAGLLGGIGFTMSRFITNRTYAKSCWLLKIM
jgi:hypothetical protein